MRLLKTPLGERLKETWAFAVGARLMDASVAVPPVQNEVAKELDLIARHEGIAVSPLMNMGV